MAKKTKFEKNIKLTLNKFFKSKLNKLIFARENFLLKISIRLKYYYNYFSFFDKLTKISIKENKKKN
jgi:hypothetical protein